MFLPHHRKYSCARICMRHACPMASRMGMTLELCQPSANVPPLLQEDSGLGLYMSLLDCSAPADGDIFCAITVCDVLTIVQVGQRSSSEASKRSLPQSAAQQEPAETAEQPGQGTPGPSGPSRGQRGQGPGRGGRGSDAGRGHDGGRGRGQSRRSGILLCSNTVAFLRRFQ